MYSRNHQQKKLNYSTHSSDLYKMPIEKAIIPAYKTKFFNKYSPKKTKLSTILCPLFDYFPSLARKKQESKQLNTPLGFHKASQKT